MLAVLSMLIKPGGRKRRRTRLIQYGVFHLMEEMKRVFVIELFTCASWKPVEVFNRRGEWYKFKNDSQRALFKGMMWQNDFLIRIVNDLSYECPQGRNQLSVDVTSTVVSVMATVVTKIQDYYFACNNSSFRSSSMQCLMLKSATESMSPGSLQTATRI